ncbi:MAG: hypothetical protein GY716_25660 [bacterium]|nr:hypothetical protein [bacterium]
MSNRPEDRREHPRYATILNLQAIAVPGGVAADMVASNLSMGGLYCTSAAEIPEMTRLAVDLKIPNGNGEPVPVGLEAVVVRCREMAPIAGKKQFELGLFFTQVDGSAKGVLADYLSRRGVEMPVGKYPA